MTEIKKLAYESEDTFILGKSLPVVAMRQLPKLADKFLALPDHPDYLPGAQRAMASSILSFYEENKHLMDDERELRRRFEKECKLHRHSSCELALFENALWEKVYP